MTDNLKEWCRIFDTVHGKVLYWCEYGGDDEGDVMHQVFKTESICLDAKLSGWNEEMNQKRFDKIACQESADKFAKESVKMLIGENK